MTDKVDVAANLNTSVKMLTKLATDTKEFCRAVGFDSNRER